MHHWYNGNYEKLLMDDPQTNCANEITAVLSIPHPLRNIFFLLRYRIEFISQYGIAELIKRFISI
jgi:hypothetical protein